MPSFLELLLLAQAHRMLLSGFHTVAYNKLRCSQSSNCVDKDNSSIPSQTLSRSLALAVINTVQGCSSALGLTDCDILIRLQLLHLGTIRAIQLHSAMSSARKKPTN